MDILLIGAFYIVGWTVPFIGAARAHEWIEDRGGPAKAVAWGVGVTLAAAYVVIAVLLHQEGYNPGCGEGLC